MCTSGNFTNFHGYDAQIIPQHTRPYYAGQHTELIIIKVTIKHEIVRKMLPNRTFLRFFSLSTF